MSDGTIVIVNWERHQHYGKAKPPWIKLYRDTLQNFEIMHRLEADERWVLVGLWMLAATHANEIPSDCGYLTHSLCANVTPQLLRKLETLGQIELRDSSRGTLEEVYTKTETETETEKKTSGNSAIVENSQQGGVTLSAVGLEAHDLLGLGKLSNDDMRANRSILTTWEGRGRSHDEMLAAIRGLRLMVDQRRSEVADWLAPDEPISLKALQNTETLFDQGDGKAKRALWDVAVEAYYADNTTPAPLPTVNVRGMPRAPNRRRELEDNRRTQLRELAKMKREDAA